jgi:hypothetical protein
LVAVATVYAGERFAVVNRRRRDFRKVKGRFLRPAARIAGAARLGGPAFAAWIGPMTSGDETMGGAARRHAPMLSVASFRVWLRSRSDEERWELIEGLPMTSIARTRPAPAFC